MHKKFLLVLLMILLIACEDQSPLVPRLSDQAVVLAFGDSLTYGTGAANKHDYPSILSRLIQREVINEGVPGEISQEGVARLSGLLDEYHPDLLVLIHGGNDMLKKIPAENTAANLSLMIDEANARGIAVIMLGVPKPNLFSLASAQIYEDIAGIKKVPVDLEALPRILSDVKLKSDLIHPNQQGYEQLAKDIEQLLVKSGALRDAAKM